MAPQDVHVVREGKLASAIHESLCPEVAAEWDHEHNKGTSADYTAQSNREVWWYNSHRGHFKAKISVRTHSWIQDQQTGQVRQLQLLAHVM